MRKFNKHKHTNTSDELWFWFDMSLLSNEDDTTEVIDKMDYIAKIIKLYEYEKDSLYSIRIHIENGALDEFLEREQNGGGFDWGSLYGDFEYQKHASFEDTILATYTPDQERD